MFRRSFSIRGILPEDQKFPPDSTGFLNSLKSYYDGEDRVVDLKTAWGFSEAFEEFKRLKQNLAPDPVSYPFIGLKLVRKSQGNPGKHTQVLLVWRFAQTRLH